VYQSNCYFSQRAVFNAHLTV